MKQTYHCIIFFAAIFFLHQTGSAQNPSYCSSYGENIFYWLHHVQLNTLDRYSGQDGGGYFHSSQTTSLMKGMPYYLYLDGDYFIYPSGYSYSPYMWASFNAWIDFNHDGQFSSGERIAAWTTSSGGELTLPFVVPSDAVEGETRMRVSIAGAGGLYLDPCGSVGNGEVEDYTVNISKYCTTGGTSNGSDYIDLISLKNADTSVIMSRNSGAESGGYKSTGAIAEVIKGSSINLEYSSGNSYPSYWKAWIDYNSDGDFFDAGEEVMINTASTSGINTVSIVIPNTIPVGRTTMRVTMSNAGFPMLTPCGSFSYGETEDYVLDIYDCSSATPLPVSGITQNSAVLSWSGANNVINYELRYRPSGSSTWTLVADITTTTHSVTNLAVGETYEWEIRSLCAGNGSTAFFKVGQTFATLCPTVPTNMEASNIGANTATLSWSDVGAQYYTLRYRLQGTSTWTEQINITATSASINFAEAGRTYEWQVRSQCPNGSITFSSSSLVNLLCLAPDGLIVTNTSTTTAELNWNKLGTSYNLQYRPAGTATWTQINNVNPPYTVISLTANTNYEWQVSKANCSNGAASAFFTGPVFYTPAPYCTVSGTNGATYVDNFELRTIQRSSANQTGGYVNTGLSLTVARGEQLNGIVSIYQQTYPWSFPQGLKAWADWNRDGDFADAGELIVTLGTTDIDLKQISFTVPSNAVLGDVRLRIGATFWSDLSSCGTNSSAEFEDYNLKVIASQTAPCSQPSGLNVDNITETSARLNWNAIAGATSYTIRVFDSYANTATEVSASTNSYNISNLISGKKYQWEVKANNGSQCDNYSLLNAFNTLGYCSLTSSSNKYWIDMVKLGGLERSSGKDGSYINTGLSVTLAPGTSHSLQVSCGVFGESYDNGQRLSVFADWNQDTDFNDLNEIVYSGSSITGRKSFTIPLTIPQSAPAGNVRLRVALDANFPCGNTGYGDVEDYTIVVGTPIAEGCTAPSNLSTTNITTSGAVISWGAVAGVGEYEIKLRREGGSMPWTTYTSTVNNFSLSNLSEGAAYSFMVRSKCNNDNVSRNSSIGDFITTGYSEAYGVSTLQRWLDLFSLGTINRTSTAEPSGYINTNLSTDIIAGSTYTGQFSAGFSAGALGGSYAVYIDYNRDGVFNLSNEEVYYKSISNASGVQNFTFTVPSTVPAGITRLRITCGYAHPRVYIDQGEVEDYIVNITAPVNPAAVRSISTEQIGSKTELLVESKNSEASIYPNPAHDVLHIELPSGDEYYEVSVVNMLGSEVHRSVVSAATLNDINVGNWARGNFVIKLKSRKSVYIFKLLLK